MLTTLDVRYTQIKDIAVAALDLGLVDLGIAGNPITYFSPLLQFKFLTNLEATGCALKDGGTDQPQGQLGGTGIAGFRYHWPRADPRFHAGHEEQRTWLEDSLQADGVKSLG